MICEGCSIVIQTMTRKNQRFCSVQCCNKQKYANLKFGSTDALRSRLLHEQGAQCNRCGLKTWNDIPITLELEHKDGNTVNNDSDNLELLCPNCHSQTPTWRGRNKNSTHYRNNNKVSDEVLMLALKEEPSIRQALMRTGLAGKGGNYKRAYELLSKMATLTGNDPVSLA